MKKEGVSAFKIAGTYIGTIVGAGFATGQEVLQFFVAFGVPGLVGIVLTTLLFALFGFLIMEMGRKLHARSHLDILRHTSGRVFGGLMDFIVSFFLFGGLTAMLAGTGALVAQQFGLPGVWGNLLMAVLTVLTVLTGINGVINSISIIVPFLLAAVLGISIFSLLQNPPNLAAAAAVKTEGGLVHHWLLSAILYTSYNTVTAIAVLGPLGAHARDKKSIVRGAVLGSLGLGAGASMIFLTLSGNLPGAETYEVPMAHIAGQLSHWAQILYSIVLIAEVYTTAVGALYGFTARVTDMERNPRRGAFVAVSVTVVAFFASLLGFSNMVKYLYPVVGYGGIILLIGLIWRALAPKRAG